MAARALTQLLGAGKEIDFEAPADLVPGDRIQALLRVCYATQRTPPPASNCSPVNQWESSEARNTAIDAMSSG